MDVYVVGAVARDIGMKLLNETDAKRRTRDLDVAIALNDWSQFEKISTLLQTNNFKKGKANQRFYYKGEDGENDYEIDIVPFGDIEENEQILWPPESNPVMSVKCFNDVMSVADTIQIDNKFTIKMAPLSGQFLIKFDTWLDRHSLTNKDALDMYYIMSNYYLANITHKQPIPNELEPNDENFDTTVWGTKWIACEMKSFLSSEHCKFYLNKLLEEINKGSESLLIQGLMLDCQETQKYSIIKNALSSMVEILNKN